MRLMIFPAVVLLALGISLPVAAEEKPVSVADQNRQICKKTESTGTRLGIRRECKTKAEWDALADVAKEDLRRTIEMSTSSAPN